MHLPQFCSPKLAKVQSRMVLTCWWAVLAAFWNCNEWGYKLFRVHLDPYLMKPDDKRWPPSHLWLSRVVLVSPAFEIYRIRSRTRSLLTLTRRCPSRDLPWLWRWGFDSEHLELLSIRLRFMVTRWQYLAILVFKPDQALQAWFTPDLVPAHVFLSLVSLLLLDFCYLLVLGKRF